MRGALTVAKSAGAQGMGLIEASHEQKTGNYTYGRITRIETSCGRVSEPQRWEVETFHAPCLPLTGNKVTYELANPEIIRRRGSQKTSIHVGEVNVIHYYNLFCMIPDADETMSIAFSMIDVTGQIRHGCNLRFNKKIRTIIREDEYTLRRFDLTGEGILPTSFWATTEGKIILVVSGMDILLLGAVM